MGEVIHVDFTKSRNKKTVHKYTTLTQRLQDMQSSVDRLNKLVYELKYQKATDTDVDFTKMSSKELDEWLDNNSPRK